MRCRIPGLVVATFLVAGLFVAGCDGTGGVAEPFGQTDAVDEASLEPIVDETAEPTPSPPPPAFELSAAVEDGKVKVTLRGESLQGLELTLESKIDTDIRVVVNPATMFVPRASGTQTMVVIEKEVVTLEAETTAEVELEVACAEMHDDTPTAKDGFRIASDRAPSALVKLLRLPGFADEEFRVQQFAIWTITDNPTRSGYVGLRSWEASGGPTDEELDRVAELFAEADIPAGHYRALR